MIIRCIRHGESEANVQQPDPTLVGNHSIPLTSRGVEQARATGAQLGAETLRSALLYCSPYTRTRQTLRSLLQGANVDPASVRIFEDPRLRELDHGYEPVDEQRQQRGVHGSFYYRYRGGESPADCYDRCCTFLTDLFQQIERKANNRVIIVSHSLTIRCLVTRFLHLSVEQFETMRSIPNAAVVTLQAREAAPDPVFSTGRWGAWGLPLHHASSSARSD